MQYTVYAYVPGGLCNVYKNVTYYKWDGGAQHSLVTPEGTITIISTLPVVVDGRREN